jgi:hypothetical protein
MKSYRRSIAASAAFVVVALASTAGAQDRRQDPRRQDKRQEDQRQQDQRQQPKDPRQQGDQQRRIEEERSRQVAYQRALDARVQVAQAREAQLQAQNRAALVAQHQQYLANLEAQRRQLQAQRNYTTEPYFNTPPTYRYRYGNVARETNQYGAEVLRAAVNNGYQQGVLAGRADRQDRRASDYRNNFAYQDANYGYNGRYVAQADYNNYFREGFRRGYADGYAQQSQYGTFNNGSASILGTVLNSILGLTNLH